MSEFESQLQDLSDRVLASLQENPGTTAWDLKLRLKSSLSQLYIALGILLQKNLIRVLPDGLTYRIHPAIPQPPEPPVEIDAIPAGQKS